VPVVGIVARLVREKGLLEFFAAARVVRERVPGVRFLLVGPVDTEKRDAVTPEVANEHGIGDICHFVGTRLDMPEMYALMDVLVLPSHREGFPRAPMEASAMTVPCVVTDIRGCREAVEHGRNGLLVPLGDIQALADAMVELLTDRERARRMGMEGRRMALERFDERHVFERVLAEYERLLREKRLPLPTPQPRAVEVFR
jgi:glycosyltransferase involved in cell wall biosynthesis